MIEELLTFGNHQYQYYDLAPEIQNLEINYCFNIWINLINCFFAEENSLLASQ